LTHAADENRGHLLEAGLPQVIVSLLEGYTELIPVGAYTEPLALSIPHLKVVRTAIGVLLNASIGYGVVYCFNADANPLKSIYRLH
jgi:hypothetical protein